MDTEKAMADLIAKGFRKGPGIPPAVPSAAPSMASPTMPKSQRQIEDEAMAKAVKNLVASARRSAEERERIIKACEECLEKAASPAPASVPPVARDNKPKPKKQAPVQAPGRRWLTKYDLQNLKSSEDRAVAVAILKDRIHPPTKIVKIVDSNGYEWGMCAWDYDRAKALLARM